MRAKTLVLAVWLFAVAGCDENEEPLRGQIRQATTTYNPYLRPPPTSAAEAEDLAAESVEHYGQGKIVPDSITCTGHTFATGRAGYKCIIKDTLPNTHPRGAHVRFTTMFIAKRAQW